MKEVIFDALQLIIAAAISLGTAYLVAFLKKKREQVVSQIDNDTAKRYIEEIEKAVTTAVIATSQTYVDALKKENAFTPEAQSEALKRAYRTAISMLSISAMDFVRDVYGSLDKYLTAKIEETVRVQKQSEPLLISEAPAVPWAIFESSEETE